MKKKSMNAFLHGRKVKKWFLMMKLTMLLFLAGLMQVSATVYSQATKFNFRAENKQIVEVLKEIEELSDFRFFYIREQVDVERRVSVKANSATVEQILDELFKDEGISYKVMDDYLILLSPDKKITEMESVSAQQKSVSGKVTDIQNQPLPGVTVLIKGTTRGTITDANGEYTVTNVPEDATLVFSFVGMLTQEVVVGNQTSINVTIMEDVIGIEEVVAVGYGIQKKVNLTGAVASVDTKVLESRSIVNLGQGLQGVIPNLNISFANGAPGKGADFNIRGDNSISGGKLLVLVDNVEMDINLINPADIVSISVLKDGASAAIYGARGGYGVILIKTKGGEKNKPAQISYDGNVSFNSFTIEHESINSLDYMNYRNAASINSGAGVVYDDTYIARVKNYIANPTPENSVFTPDYFTNDPGRYGYSSNTDWFKEQIKENAIVNLHTVGISGGSENTTYYGSVNYLDQGGFLRYFDDSYKRFNVKLNIESDINKWLTFFGKVTVNHDNRSTPNLKYDWFLYDEQWVFGANEPMMPVRHPDGNYAGQGWWANFIQVQNEGGKTSNEVNDSWLQGGLKIKPFKGLVVNFDYNYNYYDRGKDSYVRSSYDHYADPNRLTLFPHLTPNSFQQIRYTNKYNALNLFAQYDKTIGKNTISAIVGFNQEDKSMVSFSAKRENLISNDFPSIRQATGNQFVDGTEKEWAIRGAFFRLNYMFNEKYLLELNGRYDGTSRFPKDSRFAFFPSVSAAWRISKENFFEPITNIVSELKVRGSYSNLGNQTLGTNYYPYIASLGSISQIAYIIDGIRPVAVTPSGLVSPGLTWETIKQFNIGLDFGLLQNKITGSFDIYQRSTFDMLTAGQPLPAVLGTGVPLANAADMKTNGFELSLHWRDEIFFGDLKYYVGASLSDYQSEITRFTNPQGTLGNHYVGKKLGEIWGYKSFGLFQTSAEVTAAPSQTQIWGGAWAPGDVKYEDLNGDGKVDNGKYTLDDPGDLTIIGNSTPRFLYSLNGGLDWKGFDFSFLIQGIAKRDAWLGWEFWSASYNVTEILDSWSPTNTDAYFPRPLNDYTPNNQVSSRYLQDASYMRLKNMTLGYTIPKSSTEKIQISDVRVYISTENLFTFTRLNRNFDPEFIYNARTYPIQRAISLGINVKF